MPQALNPANGYFVNANNDPAGTTLDNDPLNQRRPGNPAAIYYLNPGYDEGLRAGRITRLLQDELARSGRISVEDMRRFQGNTQQLDAELLLPFLITAWRDAGRAGAPAALASLRADPALAEAMGRLEAWDFSTPTGIPEGWDASDPDGERLATVPPAERSAAVAATIYNVWRALAVQSVVDARLAGLGVPGVGSGDALKALHFLLVRFAQDQGEPVEGVDFFPEPAGFAPADRRDLALLEALRAALDRLASDAFAPAFANSTDQDDYLWGKLHRITFDAELAQYSVPPQNGFQDLAPDLPGISRDGGYDVVNASGFSARADAANEFRFGGGPVRRYVGAAGLGVSPAARVEGWNVIPGGSSGIPGDPRYTKQLPTWLTADQHPVEMFETQAEQDALSVERFVPAAP
jgi:penicillin amidase